MINKIDLLPHLDFDLDRFLANIDAVNPGVEHLLVSARTGEGIDEWRDWLGGDPRARRGARLSEAACPGLARTDALAAPASTSCSPARTEANREFFEAEAERLARCCHGWPSASRAAAGWSRSGSRPRRARTRATSPSSSSTR